MKRYDRYQPGDVASASRFNAENAEAARLAKLSVTPPLYMHDTAAGICLRVETPPASIAVNNVGGTIVAAMTAIELTVYHDTSNSHDGQKPSSSGLVRIAIADADIAVGSGGRAYAWWANPGLVKVIAASTYSDGAAVDSGGWLTTLGGSGIAQPTRGRTNLKIIGLATPPTPALPTGQTMLWAAFMGSLG